MGPDEQLTLERFYAEVQESLPNGSELVALMRAEPDYAAVMRSAAFAEVQRWRRVQYQKQRNEQALRELLSTPDVEACVPPPTLRRAAHAPRRSPRVKRVAASRGSPRSTDDDPSSDLVVVPLARFRRDVSAWLEGVA